MSRFVKPEVVRIDLTNGDWILVRRQLTAGELRRVFARTAKPVLTGQPIEVDLEKAGISEMVAYLVDWSFTDEQGKPVAIKDMPAEYVLDVLNNLDGASFAEIYQAIQVHEASIADEKKTPSGATVS